MIKTLISLFSKQQPVPLEQGRVFMPKPELNINSTVVPESFLNSFPHWEGNLYPKQTTFKG